MLLPGLCLLLGVIVAARRGFFPDAIDGTRAPASGSLEINLRYNQHRRGVRLVGMECVTTVNH
jgi:hypothetical protein